MVYYANNSSRLYESYMQNENAKIETVASIEATTKNVIFQNYEIVEYTNSIRTSF